MHWLSLLYSGQLPLTYISHQMLFCSRSHRNQTVGRNHHTWHLWFCPPVQNHPVQLNRHLLRKSIAAYYLNGHCFLCGLIIVRREGKVIRKVERELYSTLYMYVTTCKFQILRMRILWNSFCTYDVDFRHCFKILA